MGHQDGKNLSVITENFVTLVVNRHEHFAKKYEHPVAFTYLVLDLVNDHYSIQTGGSGKAESRFSDAMYKKFSPFFRQMRRILRNIHELETVPQNQDFFTVLRKKNLKTVPPDHPKFTAQHFFQVYRPQMQRPTIGFIVVPPNLIHPCVEAKDAIDRTFSRAVQFAVSDRMGRQLGSAQISGEFVAQAASDEVRSAKLIQSGLRQIGRKVGKKLETPPKQIIGETLRDPETIDLDVVVQMVKRLNWTEIPAWKLRNFNPRIWKTPEDCQKTADRLVAEGYAHWETRNWFYGKHRVKRTRQILVLDK